MSSPVSDQRLSEYNQTSFSGGMDLLTDDSRLATNKYRVGFNVRNRYDTIDPIKSSVLDAHLPAGVLQEHVTFGNYVIAFVSGSAYYRLYNQIGWTKIVGFAMSASAPRYWTVAIPVATTNYVRYAATASGITGSTLANRAGAIQALNVAGAAAGNLPGLLVQDNVNQPQFIFLDGSSVPTCRVTQMYSQWSITFTDASNTVVTDNGDMREYVPIGNCMAWSNGILFMVSQDFSSIYRSVSGRPLDFAVNVVNTLSTSAPYIQTPGGDASTTDYSVGVGGITCIRPLSTGGVFVSASGANFAVTLNQTQNAPTEFGEYTFNRAFLFNATCLSDRSIIDTLGDTRFVDLTGIRSFNAVEQYQNEGRNSVFSATIAAALDGIIQDIGAAILYNNYELYAVNTVYGPAIAVYDTVTGSWCGFDVLQTGGKKVKQFAKIELSVQALFAITEDDKLYQLYASNSYDSWTLVTAGMSSNMSYAGSSVRLNNAKNEIKPIDFRAIINKITTDATVSVTLLVNNRLTPYGTVTKNIKYNASVLPYTGTYGPPSVDTMLVNLYYAIPNALQGWKAMYIVTGTGSGSLTQFTSTMMDETPLNPVQSQSASV